MIPQLIGFIAFIINYEFLNWRYDKFIPIFVDIKMHNLRVWHRVSVNEPLLISSVFKGIKVSFYIYSNFLVRHKNLRPYNRPNVIGVHDKYIFREKFATILNDNIFHINALYMGASERLEHLPFAVDYAWWSSFRLFFCEIGRDLGYLGPFGHGNWLVLFYIIKRLLSIFLC